MHVRSLLLLSGFFLCATPPEAPAFVPRETSSLARTAIEQSPVPYPSPEEVLRALPNGPLPGVVHIRYRLLFHREGEARFYPLVGTARLIETGFRCTVISRRGEEVVHIDKSRLRPAK